MKQKTKCIIETTILFLLIFASTSYIINTQFSFSKIKSEANNSNKLQNIAYDYAYDQAEKLTSNYFIENKGQFDLNYEFYVKLPGFTLAFTTDRITFFINNNQFSISFNNANGIKPTGCDKLSSYSNFYYKNEQYTYVTHFNKITYNNLYDGITLVYYISAHGLKYDFRIEPFADVSQIMMLYDGLDDIKVQSNKVIFSLNEIKISDENLISWYSDNNENLAIRFYQLDTNFMDDNFKVRFSLPENYDNSRGIIIDPLICLFSTFLGGSLSEHPTAGGDVGEKDLAIDHDNNIIICGRTTSTDFPTAQPYQDSLNGSCDCSIVKLSPDGQTLLFASYFGGNDEEWVTSVAIDSLNNIGITGTTFSTNFPLLNELQGTFLGSPVGYSTDAFVAKFDENGTLIFSTYWQGSYSDWGYGIDFDDSGYIYVTGSTSSDDFFTVNAYQDTIATFETGDIFLTKFSPDGQSVLFSTYLGGDGPDAGLDLKIDNENNVIITGRTEGTTFPTLNPYQTSIVNNWACVLVKFNSTGELEFSTTIDGNFIETGYGIAIDDDNNIIIAGGTTSSDFPMVDATRPTSEGAEAFIAKFSPDGQSLLYSTYFGGGGGEEAHDITLDKDGNYVLVGKTTSPDLPLIHTYQLNYGGNYDAFVTVIAVNGTILSVSYLGGAFQDEAIGVKVDSDNAIIIGGATHSSDFPTQDAYQSTLAGTSDLFVTKLYLNLTLPNNVPTPTPSTTPTEPVGFTVAFVYIIGILSLLGIHFVAKNRKN
ncbi:MAG: hypothetical protein FK734_06335 [Asgard group archaeon]|nr:hypothetical protein [Asgard group archaeon]